MNLFQTGDFTLNSGAKSAWKIECDALTVEDWQALARMAKDILPPFSEVCGVPRGGNAFAEALRAYRVDGAKRYLIADDVLTSGGSMSRLRDRLVEDYKYELWQFIGIVAFARGPCPYWTFALFTMPEQLWVAR